MLLSCLAAAFTFTASATGVGKGTPVEFLFVGKDSDRDYEAMFAIDMPIADLARAVEKAGLKPGQPIDSEACRVWPVGTPVAFDPPVSKFVVMDESGGFSLGRLVYTGGLRGTNGVPVAATDMPASVCSLYSLGQSLFLPEGMLEQGDVYGKFCARETLKKLPGVLAEPAPAVAVASLDDSAVTINLRPWAACADYWAVYSAAQEAVKKAFDECGITIPFPQIDVHMISGKV